MNYQDKTVGSVELPDNAPAWLIQLAASVENVEREEFFSFIEKFKNSAQKKLRYEAIAEARNLVAQFKLAPGEVFQSKPRGEGGRSTVAPKYRDPATGQTWSGRGKAPKWLEGKDRGAFTIAP